MFDDELRKLQESELAMSEANVTTNHLDRLTRVRFSLLLQCNIQYMNFTDALGTSLP